MRNCNISVLHIGHLHQLEVAPIENVDLYDISSMSYTEILGLVEKLQMNMMVFFSFRSLMELVLQRICTSHGIRQVYLEHGLFSNDTLKFRKDKLKKEKGVVLKRQLHFLWMSYGRIFHSENIRKELVLFYKVYIKGCFNLSPHDSYFLFSERSYDLLKKVYNLDKKRNVEYVGYPIFTEEAQKTKVGRFMNNDGVLYVHQPLISDGIAHVSYQEEKEYLLKLANVVKDKYGRLTILLHPRADLKMYKKMYDNTGIEVIMSPNNFELFVDKALIVGHYSTALLYGLYFEKPTVVIDYPTVKNDTSFSDFFIYCKDIDDIGNLDFSNNENRKTYLVGEYNTYEHIAKTLCNYAAQ